MVGSRGVGGGDVKRRLGAQHDISRCSALLSPSTDGILNS